MSNPKPRFTGRFGYSPFGAGGQEPIYRCPPGYQISMDQKECVPDEQYEYKRKLYGGPPIRSNADVIREFEMSNLKHKVCNYLKQKIAEEDKETTKYQKLGIDLRDFDVRKYGYIPYLLEAQRNEIKWLKAIYDKLCGGR